VTHSFDSQSSKSKVLTTEGTEDTKETLHTAQALDDLGDIVFLEQADGGDTGGTGFQTGLGIFQRDASEGDDRDVCFACFAEKVEACRARIFLLEDWGEYGEGGMVRCGPSDFCGRVTGDCDEGIS